ncbi:MAG TPA: ABC transporter, partial [Alcaligenes faecalis]|nr:ABC transporter [Alcaligenes faecalis]
EQGRYARLWTLGGYDNRSKDTSC